MELNFTVPQDMSALDFLVGMKKQTKNAWIYLHKSVVKKLCKSAGVDCEKESNDPLDLSLEATDEYPATRIVISRFVAKNWYIVIEIEAENIAFKEIKDIENPEYTIRLWMDA